VSRIRRIEVVIDPEASVNYCRPYKYDPTTGIQLCFDAANRLVRVLYEPEVFKRLGIERIERRLEECEICKQAEEVIAKYKKTSLREKIRELARREGVPEPTVVFFPCPYNPSTSCTLGSVDSKGNRRAVIFIHPDQMEREKVWYHEFYHYKKFMKEGHMGSEHEANEYAGRVAGDVSLYTPVTASMYGDGAMFEKLNSIYAPGADLLGTTPEMLNLAITPEILARIVEAFSKTFLRTLPQKIIHFFLGLGLMAANKWVGGLDGDILVEMGAHLATDILELAIPVKMAQFLAEARALGYAVAAQDSETAVKALVRTKEDLDMIMNTLKSEWEKLIGKAPEEEGAPSPAPAPAPAPTEEELGAIEKVAEEFTFA